MLDLKEHKVVTVSGLAVLLEEGPLRRSPVDPRLAGLLRWLEGLKAAWSEWESEVEQLKAAGSAHHATAKRLLKAYEELRVAESDLGRGHDGPLVAWLRLQQGGKKKQQKQQRQKQGSEEEDAPPSSSRGSALEQVGGVMLPRVSAPAPPAPSRLCRRLPACNRPF